MRKQFIIISLSLLCLCPSSLFAWGQKGHRIIAEIAYRHLSPVARHRVDKVLGSKDGMVYWSNWADEIKSDTIYPTSYDWHFQDLNEGLTDEQLVSFLTQYPAEGGNLFRAIDSLKVRLHNNRNEVHNLRFLIHFEGDRFCPMHTGRMDDLGGNKVKVQWFGQNTNLHAIWDGKILEYRGYSFSEYADFLENTYAPRRREIEQMTDEQILIHNYRLCNEIYEYQKTWNGNAYHYVYHFADACELQLYMAGIRLAQILNRLY